MTVEPSNYNLTIKYKNGSISLEQGGLHKEMQQTLCDIFSSLIFKEPNLLA